MYWKYSLGFLIASLTQAAIIAVSEALGISTLGAKITFAQLIIHILVGQAVGFLLMVIMQSIKGIAKTNLWLLGSIYGAIVWAALVAPKILCILRKSDNSKWFRGARFILALYRYRNTAATGGQGLQSEACLDGPLPPC